MISSARLASLLASYRQLTIGLVGDLFLDRYLDIDPDLHELSIETGLEAYQVTRIRNSPGALGTVINNLAALGVGRLVPVSVLGDDGQAYDLLQALSRLPVDLDHLLKDPRRKTPTYTKPMQRDAQGVWRELNRLDLRNRQTLDAIVEARLAEHVEEVFHATAGLIVLDQVNEEGWGVVTPNLRQRLAGLARQHPEKLMLIDSRAHLAKFPFGTLKPNRQECLAAVGETDTSDRAAVELGAKSLAAQTGRTVFCTLGDQGILVVPASGQACHVSSIAVRGPVDIVGAGDSVTSGIAATLLAGGNDIEAATVGNLVASITIQQLGTTGTASPEQVLARHAEFEF